MNPAPLTPQKISPALAAAADAALGGPPARPPAMPTQKIGSAAPEEVLRQSFTAAAAEAQAEPAPAPAPLTGNPTFDAMPAEVTERRAKVDLMRTRLAELIRAINGVSAELHPILADLEDDSDALKATEQFDPAAARGFLTDLTATIAKLAPKASKAK